MTSTVLARKYRPRDFESLVGQAHVVQALTNALTQQRLHHAYLFTGTRGVGKTTVSRILAKSLNCIGPDGQGQITAKPCGQCHPCQDIDSGRFVDYIELDAASNRSVEEITQLLDQAVYKPVVGRYKVYMIDEVHMLSSHAFNAMLKTLEEPPDYLKFVLATTDPQKVPVTVLSRCLQFNLRPMALATIEEHLQQVLADEAVPFELGALQHLARAARGSMRDALSLTDQAIAYGSGSLQEAVVRQMLGSADTEQVLQLLAALADSNGAALLQGVDEVRKQGLSAAGMLDALLAAWQGMAVLQVAPDMVQHDPHARAIAPLVDRFAADEIQLYYSLALQGRQELSLAPDEYVALTMIVLRWLAFRPDGQAAPPKAPGPAPSQVAGPAQAVGRPVQAVPASPMPAVVSAAPPASAPSIAPVVAARPATLAREPVPVPPWEDEVPAIYQAREALPSTAPAAVMPASEPVAAPAPVQLPSIATTPTGDRWASVVLQLQQQGLIAALVRELAIQAECVQIVALPDGGHAWTLQVERESLRGDNHRDRLSDAMVQLLGEPVQLSITMGAVQDSPALRDKLAKAQRQADAEQLIRSDPLVIALLDNHPGAHIVPGSIVPL